MPAPAPAVCTVSGYIYDATGTAVSGATVTFTLNEQAASDLGALEAAGAVIAATPITVTTDATGHFSLNLIQSAALASLMGNVSTHYRVTVTSGTVTFIDGWCLIPTQASVDITALTIAPAITQVIYGPPAPTFNRP